MGFKLKTGKTYLNKYTNKNSSVCYAKIDVCNGDKGEKKQNVCLFIYTDKAAADAKAQPLETFSHIALKEDFDTYFSITALNVKNQYANGYDFLSSLVEDDRTKEPDVDGVFPQLSTYGDWETDE